MDGSRTNEAILVFVNAFKKVILQPIGCQLSQKFQANTRQGNRPIVIHTLRNSFLWDEGDIRPIDILQPNLTIMEIMCKPIKILLN
jgi:hypothetical protein